jgi:hypothetical protein
VRHHAPRPVSARQRALQLGSAVAALRQRAMMISFFQRCGVYAPWVKALRGLQGAERG